MKSLASCHIGSIVFTSRMVHREMRPGLADMLVCRQATGHHHGVVTNETVQGGRNRRLTVCGNDLRGHVTASY